MLVSNPRLKLYQSVQYPYPANFTATSLISPMPTRRLISILILFCFFLATVYAIARIVPSFGEKMVEISHNTLLEPLVLPLFPHNEHVHHEEEGEHDHADSCTEDHDHSPPSSFSSSSSSSSSSSFSSSSPANSIALSPYAAKNIGLDDSAITTITLTDYYKFLTVPAVVVERPGKSTITVPSPVSGVIAKIYVEKGISVKPGEPLFDILLNQQEMVKGQTEYLSLLKKREINHSELQRLSGLDPQMVPKQRRELEFQQAEIDLEVRLLKNTLLLQGLTQENITESLEKRGEIIRNMTLFAPPMIDEYDDDTAESIMEHTYTIEELYVTTGQNVPIGDSLCQLSDLCELALQGRVFAVNLPNIKHALDAQSRVFAAFDGPAGKREIIEGLHLRSIDNYIDNNYGTVFCYVDLQNRADTYEVPARNNTAQMKRRYTNWHFKPNQRCELNIEYETLPNCIVLPVDAVAHDLNETCVFEWVGKEGDKRIWRKQPVHVLDTTKDVVVLANDGALSLGAKVTTKGAGFILAAMDAANQRGTTGGGVQHGDHVH